MEPCCYHGDTGYSIKVQAVQTALRGSTNPEALPDVLPAHAQPGAVYITTSPRTVPHDRLLSVRGEVRRITNGIEPRRMLDDAALDPVAFCEGVLTLSETRERADPGNDTWEPVPRRIPCTALAFQTAETASCRIPRSL